MLTCEKSQIYYLSFILGNYNRRIRRINAGVGEEQYVGMRGMVKLSLEWCLQPKLEHWGGVPLQL